MQAKALTIGAVAARAGVKVDTVRYYERRGVLPRAERRRSGYRSFGPQAVERILFVKELQALGFSLDEIIALLQLVDGGRASCDAAGPYAYAAVERLDAKIATLGGMRARLMGMMSGCRENVCVLAGVQGPLETAGGSSVAARAPRE